MKKRKFWRGFTRFRLMLTLGLAVLLPAAALIIVNFSQLRSFERDKVLEAAIHRDFQERLALTEKNIDKKAYTMAEEARDLFPAPDINPQEKEKQLDLILARSPWLSHAFLYDENGIVYRTTAQQLNDKYIREEHEHNPESYRVWFASEGKMMVEGLHKKPRPIAFSTAQVKRANGDAFETTAFFVLPQVSDERIVLGGVAFEGCYLKETLFQQALDEQVKQKSTDQSGNQIAMMIYPANIEMGHEIKPITASGWGEGKPEVMRKFDDVFGGLALGIKFQGTSVEQLGETWMHRSFLILGILSLMIIGGLVLTKHIVSKEMALARLKSDFVSNVSHELRTPLSLIRLYAETLEMGRLTSPEKYQEYYCIIRKESERLTALINNILDFSRIEAGHKEYDFRDTDMRELVRNTLDSYRYQLEQSGFTFEEKIDDAVPPLRVDREAMARSLLNLVNNALKYSQDRKYIGVSLYRDNGSVKLEVTDHGIGIPHQEQHKIFEKFYRVGDPLVHNTKGSGLGLSLVRHIVQAHGGQVDVDSAPGQGSKFTIVLPVVAANNRNKTVTA